MWRRRRRRRPSIRWWWMVARAEFLVLCSGSGSGSRCWCGGQPVRRRRRINSSASSPSSASALFLAGGRHGHIMLGRRRARWRRSLGSIRWVGRSVDRQAVPLLPSVRVRPSPFARTGRSIASVRPSVRLLCQFPSALCVRFASIAIAAAAALTRKLRERPSGLGRRRSCVLFASIGPPNTWKKRRT